MVLEVTGFSLSIVTPDTQTRQGLILEG